MKNASTILFRTTQAVMLTVLVSSVVTANALAGPIVSESFDYTVGNLHNAEGGVGWETGTSNSKWKVSVNSALTGSATVESGSLFLSAGYATSGNRLRVSATASTDASSLKYITARRDVGTDVGSVGGDLWLSFLYKRIDHTFNGYDLANNITDGLQAELLNRYPNGIHMRARAKRQNLDGIQNRYNSHGDGEELTAPGINGGDTFLFVVRYQNLGLTGVGPGTGINRASQMWVLDGAGYDAVTSEVGMATPAATLYSQAHTIAHAINGNNDVDRMLNSDTMHIGHLYYGRAAVLSEAFTVDWDELRWGDSIDDILPGFTAAQIGDVPEPSTCLLMGLASLSLVGLRRRQR